MQAASGEQPIDWNQDPRNFARELLLARDAGYLEWKDPSIPNVRPLDPIFDASSGCSRSTICASHSMGATADGSSNDPCRAPTRTTIGRSPA